MTRDEAAPILQKHLGRPALTAADFRSNDETVIMMMEDRSFFCWRYALFIQDDLARHDLHFHGA